MKTLLKGSFYLAISFLVLAMLNSSCQSPKKEPAVEKDSSQSIQFVELDSIRAHRINDYFSDLHQRKKFNGVFLYREENAVIKGALGFRDYPNKAELNDTSRFQLASVSKPFTALAFMKLVEQGLFDLDTDIRNYLPDFPFEGISPRLLLSHKSGLPNYMYLSDSLWLNQQVPDSIDKSLRNEMIGEIAGKKAMGNAAVYEQIFLKKPALYAEPNRRFSYCNSNFFLLAYMMELKLRKSFSVIMDSLVFQPMGLGSSFLYNGMQMDSLENTAIGYTARYRSYVDFYINGVLGDKGMFSNVDDLLKASMALEEGFLNSKLQDEMFSKQAKTNKRGMYYGLGWRIKKYKSKKLIFHNGWWRGFRTYYMWIPEKKRTIVVLTNSTMGGFLKQEELLKLLN